MTGVRVDVDGVPVVGMADREGFVVALEAAQTSSQWWEDLARRLIVARARDCGRSEAEEWALWVDVGTAGRAGGVSP